MAKKIKHSDIFEGDIFKPTKEAAAELLKLTKEVKQGLLETGKEIKKSFGKLKVTGVKELKEFNKLVKESEKVQKAKVQVDKEEEKIKQKLKKATDDEVKERLKHQKAVKEQKDRLSVLLVEENKEAGTLQKLAAENKKLRLEREKLNLSTKEGAARLKEINLQLDKNNKAIFESSDKFKQQKLNVGNYTESIKQAIAESGIFGGVASKLSQIQGTLSKAFAGVNASIKENIAAIKGESVAQAENAAATEANTVAQTTANKVKVRAIAVTKLLKNALLGLGIGAVIAALTALTVAFTRTQKGADDLSVLTEGLKGGFEALIGVIGRFGLGLFTLLQGLGDRLKVAGLSFSKFFLEIKQGINEVASFFGKDKDESLGKRIAEIDKQIADINKGDRLSKGFDEMKAAISGASDAMKEGVREGLELGRAILEVREANLKLRKELITTGSLLELANRRASDITLSFQERQEALLEAAQLQEQVSGAEVERAKNLLRIEQLRLNAAIKAGAKDVELRENVLAAEEAVDKAETKLLVDRANREQTLRDIRSKALTNEVKILGKQFDKISQLAEKSITDTDTALSERVDSLNQLEKDSLKIFQQSVEAVEETTGKRIEANELVAESDAKVLFERIRALKLSQEDETALNKIIADRQKQIIQEVDLRKKLTKEQEANAAAIRKINAEIAQSQIDRQLIELNELLDKQKESFDDPSLVANIKKISEAIAELTNEQFDLRAEKIEKQAEDEARIARETIVEADKLAAELEKIDTNKNNKLRENDLARQKAIVDINKKTAEEVAKRNVEIANFIIDTLDEAFKKSNERRRKAIDEEIKLREESVARQQAIAEKGLANTLAFEKQKQAEAELARKEQEKREIRRQKVISYFRAFSEFLKTDPNTAATKALAQVLLADVISGAFAEGVENLNGKGTGTSDSNLALLSKGESVITAKATKENRGLPTAMNEGHVDDYFIRHFLPKYFKQGANMGNSAMLHQLVGVNKRLEGLERVISSKKETATTLDNLGNVIVTEVENGFKKTTTFKKRRARL